MFLRKHGIISRDLQVAQGAPKLNSSYNITVLQQNITLNHYLPDNIESRKSKITLFKKAKEHI